MEPLTPRPVPGLTPKPSPTVTVTKTATITMTPTPKPDAVPFTDQLQGWGTVAAVLTALVIALAGWLIERRRREADDTAGKKQREEDRKDADRRLREEREAGDRRLQQQLNEQRERDHRRFVAEQLQAATLHWSRGEVALLPGILAAIPDQYATVLRYLIRGEDYNDAVGFPPMSETTLRVLEQRLSAYGVENQGGARLLLDRVRAMEESNEQQGRSKDWSRLHPRARELYRVGYDYKKIKLAWLYEEIGDNIAELLAG